MYKHNPLNPKTPTCNSSIIITTYKMSASSFASHLLELQFHSRKLLFLHNSPLTQSPNNPSPPHNTTNNNSSSSSSSDPYLGDAGNFDANVVMVLSVLLCALICSLGLNSILRCALRCSSIVLNNNDPTNPNNPNPNNPSARVANTGVKKKALKTFPTLTYSPESKLLIPALDSECVICLSDFNNGDRLRILPKCNHGFHLRCIDKWLSSHSSCPKCRHCLIDTCHKIVGSNNSSSTSSSSSQPISIPQTIVMIAPLEPESLVRNYRGG